MKFTNGYMDFRGVAEPQNGADGADGLSTYEIAVQNGFSGTEQEWLDSLVTTSDLSDFVNNAKLTSALDHKVDKVTSTDNAIVRFDGITGSVQDSGVTIDDNDNVLINTIAELPDSTTEHKLQVNGYQLHKYGWKDNIVQITPALGDGTRWKDIGNGIFAMEFGKGDSVSVNYHINHDYAQGTNAYLHAHLICLDTQSAGATITIRMNYILAKGHSQGQSLTVPTTQFDMTYTFDGTEIAGEHIILECSDAQAFDLKEPDTLLMTKMTLQSETVTGKIYGLTMDLHYQSDREVTLNKAPDFNV